MNNKIYKQISKIKKSDYWYIYGFVFGFFVLRTKDFLYPQDDLSNIEKRIQDGWFLMTLVIIIYASYEGYRFFKHKVKSKKLKNDI